ncbi:MAG: hypothetical protein ACRC41_04960 [Sarcina sp.]
MEKCPFWSSESKIEICNKECPMKTSNDEGCVFQVFSIELSDNEEFEID